LQQNGYKIVRRNVRVPGGEIDLICTDSNTIVFVEVKTRSGRRFGSAISSVDSKKRAKLRALAADYLQIMAPMARARFDVVALDGRRISLHRNAF
ncbi:MAG: YraN family protein, partial [Candidatus Eremiobacteraeota bacterium]|nr:YraN family protein [Candidatus Eremiobacteraeota bacterium]